VKELTTDDQRIPLERTIANPTSRHELQRVYRDGLLEDTLQFWIPRSVDREQGGFLCSLDRDGTLLDSDKGMWQQCRFTWLLGKLFNTVEPRDEWLELCRHGIDFIDRHGFDSADGRMWFHVARDGRPIRKRRYAFTESFAAIAYGQFAKASGKAWAAKKARQAFNEFINHGRDPKGTQPKFTDTRPLRTIGLPMITIATAQDLRESIGLEDANHWIDESIETIEKFHVKDERQVVMETVTAEGEISDHFDGRTLNPGHAMEGAWFIMHEGKLRGDARLVKLGTRMLDYMWDRGWDNEFGGILYFVDIDGRPVQEYWHDMKFWWPQNEAIIATLLAYQLTGKEKYAKWHHMVHEWAYQHFPDPEYGEWFGYLHRDGRVSVPLKGNLWKGPFHMPRMQLTCWQLLQELEQSTAYS